MSAKALSTSSPVTLERSVPFGRSSLMRPPAFSAVPFRQGLWGRQKKNRAPPSPALTSACAASPLPRLGATVSTACLRGPPPRRRRRRRPSLRATGPRRAAGSSRPRRSPGRRPSRPSPRPPPSRRRVRSAGAQPGGSSSPLALARLVVGGSRRTLFVFNMNRAEFAPKNEQAAHREPSGIRGGGGCVPARAGARPPANESPPGVEPLARRRPGGGGEDGRAPADAT